MQFLYPSGTEDNCSLALAGFQGNTVGSDVCVAFAPPTG